jgi:hypothetical protein
MLPFNFHEAETKHKQSYNFTCCKTWSLTFREEHRSRAYENRMLRRMFRTKRDEETQGCRKLHNEELNNLYSSPNIRMIKSRLRWAGHVTCTREIHTKF